MHKKSLFELRVGVIDKQALALRDAHSYLKQHINTLTTNSLTPEVRAYLDSLSSRFCKMQDLISNKIFTHLLDAVPNDAVFFADIVQVLEKRGLLPSATWWMAMRTLRNTLTHEYPYDADYETTMGDAQELLTRAEELLTYWEHLRHTIEPLLAQSRIEESLRSEKRTP